LEHRNTIFANLAWERVAIATAMPLACAIAHGEPLDADNLRNKNEGGDPTAVIEPDQARRGLCRARHRRAWAR